MESLDDTPTPGVGWPGEQPLWELHVFLALKERQPPNCFSSSSPNLEVPHSLPSSTLKHSFLFLRERLRRDSFCSLSALRAPWGPLEMKGLEATSLLFLECPNTKGKSTLGRHSLRLCQIQKDRAVNAPLLPSLGPYWAHSWVFVPFLATKPVSPRVKSCGFIFWLCSTVFWDGPNPWASASPPCN